MRSNPPTSAVPGKPTVLPRTLLKQGPFGGEAVVRRVLVVTPSSLVRNWVKEFNKWLGKERLSVFAVDQVI